MGQLHAQLSASEQSHTLWGEDLHHPLYLSRGGRVFMHCSAKFSFFFYFTLLMFCIFGLDGELYSADSYHQRLLHGVLLP